MGKVWLITGSSRGIGRNLVEEVLQRGDQVVAGARRPEQLNDLTAKYGARILPVALDVTDVAQVEAAVQQAIDTFGVLDVLVNNAGYANSSPIEETGEEDLRAQFETNFFGVVHMTKAVLPVMRKQRTGHIMQISSIGGRVGGSPGLSAYQSAKFAVEGFSEVLINEVKPLGIKVSIIEPGGFRTDWGGPSMQIREVGADYEETVGKMHRFRKEIDGKMPGDPARAAKVIADMAELEQPPLRLLLGSDALKLARESSRSRATEAEQWAEVTMSTDFSAE
ncbi:oxidoreductase [Paenibacillus sp. P96]|uniref:Oxidoreductase n=1 Tax=Paenibacillus zeirhizosphaerae TaxID=2987519 RepID=A0ABT9FT48_9BACL|nr:oxidoreductase [Paenibacillus sp. P96]MDP4097790.1 oxidoreductase [Paenibacillus sp. P96]